MATADNGKLDPELVGELYRQYGDELRRFVLGIVRDPNLVNDVIQIAYSKLLERGHETQEQSRKAWLFRVAMNEALNLRRKSQLAQRTAENLAWWQPQSEEPDDRLVRSETVRLVQLELQRLPSDQREVVELRIYAERTFVEIAAELKIPLGTALARMRSAMQKLRMRLSSR